MASTLDFFKMLAQCFGIVRSTGKHEATGVAKANRGFTPYGQHETGGQDGAGELGGHFGMRGLTATSGPQDKAQFRMTDVFHSVPSPVQNAASPPAAVTSCAQFNCATSWSSPT